MMINFLVSFRAMLPLTALLCLIACGDGTAQSGPGGLTPEDADALDQAAEKLDTKALPPPALVQPPSDQQQSALMQPGTKQSEGLRAGKTGPAETVKPALRVKSGQ